MRYGGRLFRSGSLFSAPEVVGFFRDRWGIPWEASESFGLIGLRSGGRRVLLGSLGSLCIPLRGSWLRSGSLGSLGCALGVIWFV